MKSEKEIIKKIVELSKELGKRYTYIEIEQRKPVSPEYEKHQEEKIKNMIDAARNVEFTLNTIIDTVFE